MKQIRTFTLFLFGIFLSSTISLQAIVFKRLLACCFGWLLLFSPDGVTARHEVQESFSELPLEVDVNSPNGVQELRALNLHNEAIAIGSTVEKLLLACEGVKQKWVPDHKKLLKKFGVDPDSENLHHDCSSVRDEISSLDTLDGTFGEFASSASHHLLASTYVHYRDILVTNEQIVAHCEDQLRLAADLLRFLANEVQSAEFEQSDIELLSRAGFLRYHYTSKIMVVNYYNLERLRFQLQRHLNGHILIENDLTPFSRMILLYSDQGENERFFKRAFVQGEG